MERVTVNLFAMVSVTFFLIGVTFGSCASRSQADTTPAVGSCESYLQSQLASKGKPDTQVDGANKRAPDGTKIIMVRIINAKAREAYIYAFTTTEVGAKALGEAGLTAGPRCEEAGQVWSSYSLVVSESI